MSALDTNSLKFEEKKLHEPALTEIQTGEIINLFLEKKNLACSFFF